MHRHMLSTLCQLLLLLLVFATSSDASTLPHISQEVLNPPRTYRTLQQPSDLHTSSYLDAAPNSVGVLFTTAGGEEEEVIHLWFPLGARVYARSFPYCLPSFTSDR